MGVDFGGDTPVVTTFIERDNGDLEITMSRKVDLSFADYQPDHKCEHVLVATNKKVKAN